jgi:hypothetical protein
MVTAAIRAVCPDCTPTSKHGNSQQCVCAVGHGTGRCQGVGRRTPVWCWFGFTPDVIRYRTVSLCPPATASSSAVRFCRRDTHAAPTHAVSPGSCAEHNSDRTPAHERKTIVQPATPTPSRAPQKLGTRRRSLPQKEEEETVLHADATCGSGASRLAPASTKACNSLVRPSPATTITRDWFFCTRRVAQHSAARSTLAIQGLRACGRTATAQQHSAHRARG